jgi:hypothetical protein
VDGGLDAPERRQLWVPLAELNAQLGNREEAGVCWLHALWPEEQPPAEWTRQLFRTEAAAAARNHETTRRPGRFWVSRNIAKTPRDLTGEDLDLLLALAEPAPADLRALAAYLVHASQAPSAALLELLPRLHQFLESHERLLPVRAAWLAWYHLAQLSGGDTLALARARDRVLERLFQNGLWPDQELPGFLRFAGQAAEPRFRAARQWLVGLGGLAHDWLKEEAKLVPDKPLPLMDGYADFVFAFGLAKLGEQESAREALVRGRNLLQKGDEVHRFLGRAFEYRVNRLLEHQTHGGPLPEKLLADIPPVRERDNLPRYLIDRMREISRILEPDQRLEAYRAIIVRASDLERELVALMEMTDVKEMNASLQRLLKEADEHKDAFHRLEVLATGLEIAPRLGEAIARDLLARATRACEQHWTVQDAAVFEKLIRLLERALFVAAHFDAAEYIHPLVGRFRKILESQRGADLVDSLDRLAGQCFRGLRKVGMRDEIDPLLKRMADLLLDGKDIEAVDVSKAGLKGPALRALLQVAGNWYYFGRDHRAELVIQAARAALYGGTLEIKEKRRLACTYAATVVKAPVELAQARLEELFRKLRGVRDSWTTSSHYSVLEMEVLEAVVMAVVGDESALGGNSRRWLDDDEFLVRRRIHRDLKTLQGQL